MLIRKADGKLIEINKYDYKNDHIYYKKIMQLKNLHINAKEVSYSDGLIQKMIHLPK
jgi:hypothetical protein